MEAKDHLKMQAQIWKQEARTQAATVHKCYQLCTGAKGEPGDWHGAEPVRAVVAERDWLRNALEHIAGSCDGRAAEEARAALMGPNAKVSRGETTPEESEAGSTSARPTS